MSKTLDILYNEYFEWLYDLVCKDRFIGHKSYLKLFENLNNKEFIYILDMDGNRAKDGIELRYLFACDYDRSNTKNITEYLDSYGPCSVLEMLVALANRCEVQIMSDPEMGDRTGLWFWIMMDNLGLRSMDDKNFDPIYVDKVINRMMYRTYEKNGKGGLFMVDCDQDMRTVEIWYQLCWYLNNII